VGCLVYVGRGRHPPEWLAAVLAGRDRTAAAPTFSASGLYLTRVVYDPVWELPGAVSAEAPGRLTTIDA
jgi:tRNA pseudouridine38-40 synthase